MADSLVPPVSGYERPRARWTVPPIFSSSRVSPTARSMPVLVPMPTSPSRRAPSSVASMACRTSSPSSARAATTTPSRNSKETPETRTPRGEDGTPNRTKPEADDGPVNTSPEGMLRRPSEFTHTRPATPTTRSVPSPSMRSSEACRQPLDQTEPATPTAPATPPRDHHDQGTAHATRTPRSPPPTCPRPAPTPPSATPSRTTDAPAPPREPRNAHARRET